MVCCELQTLPRSDPNVWHQVVVLPVLGGAWLNQQFPRAVTRAAPFAPLVAVAMVALICASIVAQNAAAVKTAGVQLLAAICALHMGTLTRASDIDGLHNPVL